MFSYKDSYKDSHEQKPHLYQKANKDIKGLIVPIMDTNKLQLKGVISVNEDVHSKVERRGVMRPPLIHNSLVFH